MNVTDTLVDYVHIDLLILRVLMVPLLATADLQAKGTTGAEQVSIGQALAAQRQASSDEDADEQAALD